MQFNCDFLELQMPNINLLRFLTFCAPLDDLLIVITHNFAGSEISFFKNGVCQGVAFTNLFGGQYYPAASMYTLPNQPNCEVRFNFGPDFNTFPQDFGGRAIPHPMSEVAYHGLDCKVEGAENGFSEKTS